MLPFPRCVKLATIAHDRWDQHFPLGLADGMGPCDFPCTIYCNNFGCQCPLHWHSWEQNVGWEGGFLFSFKTHLYAFLHVYSTTVDDIPMPHLLLRALCGGFFKIHDGAISHFFWLIQESGVEWRQGAHCWLPPCYSYFQMSLKRGIPCLQVWWLPGFLKIQMCVLPPLETHPHGHTFHPSQCCLKPAVRLSYLGAWEFSLIWQALVEIQPTSGRLRPLSAVPGAFVCLLTLV